MRLSAPLVIAALLVAPASHPEDPTPEPVASGIVEKVEVKLVLLDVLVLDRRDHTVPSLGREDFEIYVDGRPVAIESVDVDCPAGATPDVRPGDGPATTVAEMSSPRRIVHVFDYYHIDSAARTLEQAREAVRRHSRDGDEQMLVAIGPGLRIEQGFTSDLAVLDRGLERMHGDLGLYGANLGRLTERRFYQRVESLMDFLERVDGSKVVVLYSGPFLDDGFDYDPEFRRIAALSARARVALYPVDSGGLRTPTGFVYGDLGGPKQLARLAVETGGRVTYHTNDLGLAFARAQRDLGCRYTLGFHDVSPILDRARAVRVWLRRSGLRVIHPVFYVIRSDERLLADRVRTARMVPEMFDAGGMRVEARALRPQGTGRWAVLVSVELPEAARAPAPGEPWKLEGAVRSASGATLARFRRELASPTEAVGGVFEARVDERLSVGPGAYQVAVLLTREGLAEPLATAIPLDLPPIPHDELFLVGPHIGRVEQVPPSLAPGEADADLEPRFEPLPATELRRGAAVDALTWVCRVGRGVAATDARVERTLTSESGEPVEIFETAVLRMDGSRAVDCRPIVDSIPTASLSPGRYALRARLEAQGVPVEVPIAVSP